MLEVPGRATVLKGCIGVSEYHTLSAFIEDILEEGVQVYRVSTQHLRSHIDILGILPFQMPNCEEKGAVFSASEGGEGGR